MRTFLARANRQAKSASKLLEMPTTLADIQVIRVLREAAKIIDIELTDHVIVGDKQADPQGVGFHSFRAAGLL